MRSREATATTERVCAGLGASRRTLRKGSESGRPHRCFLVRDRRSGRATQEMQRHRYAKSSITEDITRAKLSSELKRRMIKASPNQYPLPLPGQNLSNRICILKQWEISCSAKIFHTPEESFPLSYLSPS
ncbi:uncharacterized protein LOC125034819 isoform X1 [Penaeus chinensis]|uniref:uncharacterized protein LOC125034819 isoform X1 n=1 Tax=Penaeus chinensis TaxID=139456 RepID=UPI001FB81721|nr:uncharacterized protein LOC125034819 isoform X1 [Penaeus chinensis]XP_047482768.1 uncharacterized protein LOC125034819 isoform X1 [Penaeus chinensis]XP_047482770.1 uncharacterized protein LOC125034819 isoform X1 [Penaeus chinensis]